MLLLDILILKKTIRHLCLLKSLLIQSNLRHKTTNKYNITCCESKYSMLEARAMNCFGKYLFHYLGQEQGIPSFFRTVWWILFSFPHWILISYCEGYWHSRCTDQYYHFRDILAYIYIPLLQKEIDTFREVVWNSHRIRSQRDAQLPKGVPNHVYSFPESYDAVECGKWKGSFLQLSSRKLPNKEQNELFI